MHAHFNGFAEDHASDNPRSFGLWERSLMRTYQGECLDILKRMSRHQVTKQSQRIMMVHVRSNVQVPLAVWVLPVSDRILMKNASE